ncbi:MAG: hypothetical protein QOD81_3612 [Solirubrobacteraceae bacterium]|nr:hypothetical protein [Solirubrobacteraceae bacterium]
MGAPAAWRGAAPLPAIAVAAAGLFGAEAVHTAVLASHWREWWAEGAFFGTLSIVEGALGAALLLAPGRRLARAGVLISIATIAVWAWSRSTGLPIGPEAGYPEPVGRADLVATLLEALTAAALAPAARRSMLRRRPRAAGSGRRRTAAAVMAVALVTAYGLGGAGDHHGHARHEAPTPINVIAAGDAA